MALNKAMVIGHLGQKPELRYIPTSGAAVTGFSVATNDVFLDKQGQNRSASTGTTSSSSESWPRPAQSTWTKAARCTSKGAYGRERGNPAIAGRSSTAPRLLHSAYNSSAHGPLTFRREVEPPSGTIDEDIPF